MEPSRSRLPAIAFADGVYTFFNVTLSDGVTTQLCQSVTMTTQGCQLIAHTYDQLSLTNVSLRGKVGFGDDVLIMGFIIPPGPVRTVMVLARGPSLAQYGIPNVLQDPVLSIYSGEGPLLDSNDDWAGPERVEEILAPGRAPSDPREAATFITPQPGPYTAIVSGKLGGQGVAIVELFAR